MTGKQKRQKHIVEKDKVYLNADEPVDKRVKNLLSLMTLEEKIAQIGSLWVYEILEGKKFSGGLGGRESTVIV